jgi:Family of unknown function (DUF5641)
LRVAIQQFDQEKILAELTPRNIEWFFNPPSAPHMGGSWERLVRSVKTALRSTLKERAPKPEVLYTLMVEAENIVNSRPLTHVAVDPSDPESLTPNHFLFGSSSGCCSSHYFVNSTRCLYKNWKLSQQLADHFWKRWVREYLPSLTKQTKWYRTMEAVKVGDLVLIADGHLERNNWPRGIIAKVYPGRDGVVRVVDVQTNKGNYKRPVSKICVLNVRQ